MIKSGILDKTRLISHILLIVLLAGNIYFSIQYIANIQKPGAEGEVNVTSQIKTARFFKSFIDKVLNNQGTVSFEDRVQLENEVLQIHDVVVNKTWNDFVNSKTSKEAQSNAVKLMALLVDRI